MRTRIPNFIRCFTSCRLFLSFATLALVTFVLGLHPQVALAQSGVDNSTSTGVFQMEGDAQRTGTICWLPTASGGPAIATPVVAGTNSTDANGCPTVNPAGAATAWFLITYGANTDDWSSFVFSAGHFTKKAHSLFDPAFVTDEVNSATDNSFLGTSTKDTFDIPDWAWSPHAVQDKDDIEHAYAGAYHLTNGDTAIYAGMDRFSNAGDSTAGFWFVQDSTFALCTGVGTAAGPNGNVVNTSCTATGTFVGKHADGDVLLVSDFSQGGAVSTITVFVWNGANLGITCGSGSSGSLCLDTSRSPAPCDPRDGGDNLCGLVNNAFTQQIATTGKFKGGPILAATTVATGGWPFIEKTAGATSFVTGEFLEIGVDLNKLFPGGVPCFSTFFSETRSSTAATASLSDLTTPVSFPLCSLTVSKTCSAAKIVNGSQVEYDFTGSVTNTGSSTLYSPMVYDTPPTSIVGNVTLHQPAGPIPANSSTNGGYSGSFVSSSILGQGDKNRVSAAASSSSSGSPLNVVCGVNPPTTDANECSDWGSSPGCSPAISSGLTLNKLCSTCLKGGTDLHVSVNEAFKLCNTGNTNVTGIEVDDCQGGQWTSGSCTGIKVVIVTNDSLAPAVNSTTPTCKTYTNTYTPTTTVACLDSFCTLHDEAIAFGNATFVGRVNANNGAAASANCPVCPINTTCTTPSF
jgi:hypothetical protein